jgi:hypothetical protein
LAYKQKAPLQQCEGAFCSVLRKDYIFLVVSFLVVSFLVVSDIFIFEVSAIFNESAALAESAILAESAEDAPDLLLQAAKETAIANAKKPTFNEFFMFSFLK